ncbi:MAG: saccharopine dehydrogenase NADP-binding domain-containing protein [Candidatus Bathyarchaeota archaeon]|nr:MAG: saccharopine dehydrogenase NADP-binding domain-containing protein [Candidatus Bathyarchaeota archaeon]
MKKVLIVGAGAQGGPCASILAKNKDVSEIVLGDIDLELAKKVKERIRSDKVIAMRLDAGNFNAVVQASKGADAIINLTLTEYDVNIMEAALKNGIHYVDTSFGEPNLKDIYSRDNILLQIIENRPITLDKEFKDAGLTALLGCGGSPGMINVLTRYICDKLEQVDEIRIRLGGRKALKPPKEVVSAWTPTWSPFRALWGYSIEPTIFVDGQYKKYPIFSCPEIYNFPDPVGPVLQTLHQHQEPISIPHFIGKGIKYCDFKYPVDARVGAFVKMGFASPDAIDVKGVKIIPRDVLLKLVRPPVNRFLTETDNTAKEVNIASFNVIEVKGVQSGEEVNYKIARPGLTAEEQLNIYRRFGATRIGVAMPAIVGVEMCVKGIADRGVISAECLDPKIFLQMHADMGAPVRFFEVLTKDVAFK